MYIYIVREMLSVIISGTNLCNEIIIGFQEEGEKIKKMSFWYLVTNNKFTLYVNNQIAKARSVVRKV